MGLDAETMVANIAGGASSYLVEFLPVGAFIIGLTIAFVVGEWLVDLFVFKKRDQKIDE
jgi:hypothetical protein